MQKIQTRKNSVFGHFSRSVRLLQHSNSRRVHHKKVSDNIITKSVKHQKNVVVKILFRAKIVGMNHYKKPKREKSSAEVVIHVGKND